MNTREWGAKLALARLKTALYSYNQVWPKTQPLHRVGRLKRQSPHRLVKKPGHKSGGKNQTHFLNRVGRPVGNNLAR